MDKIQKRLEKTIAIVDNMDTSIPFSPTEIERVDRMINILQKMEILIKNKLKLNTKSSE